MNCIILGVTSDPSAPKEMPCLEIGSFLKVVIFANWVTS